VDQPDPLVETDGGLGKAAAFGNLPDGEFLHWGTSD
jgi:hypothetical protein